MSEVCPFCRKPDCDDDCGELHAIYHAQQREKLRDLMLDDAELAALTEEAK